MFAISSGCGANGSRDPIGSFSSSERRLVDAPDGLSGLASDAKGNLWAVAEKSSMLVELAAHGPPRRVPIRGVPEHIELEAVAFLANGDLLIGTESDDVPRSSDAVLHARRTQAGDAFIVDGQIPLPYQQWEIEPPRNQGIEALCVSGGSLVVIAEPIRGIGEMRFAPLGIYDLKRSQWRANWVKLTSEEGKIAGLSCRVRGEDIELFAIERHFSVRRVVRGTIDADAVGHVTNVEVAVELSSRIENFEGIELYGRSAVALVTDNHSGGRHDGPAVLLVAEFATK